MITIDQDRSVTDRLVPELFTIKAVKLVREGIDTIEHLFASSRDIRPLFLVSAWPIKVEWYINPYGSGKEPFSLLGTSARSISDPTCQQINEGNN